MTSQIKYSTPTLLALLQVYTVMMDGEIMDFDYFQELVGLTRPIYLEVMKLLKEMIEDLHLSCSLQKIETNESNNKTEYIVNRYKLISRIDFSFILNEDLDDMKKIQYSDVIVYLKLKNRQYVAYDSLANYFPNFTRRVFAQLIMKLQEVIGEDLFKDEYQSYIISEEL